jgi:hypothetical protein
VEVSVEAVRSISRPDRAGNLAGFVIDGGLISTL